MNVRILFSKDMVFNFFLKINEWNQSKQEAKSILQNAIIVAEEDKYFAMMGERLTDNNPNDKRGIILDLFIYYSKIKLANKTISCTLIKVSPFISDKICCNSVRES